MQEKVFKHFIWTSKKPCQTDALLFVINIRKTTVSDCTVPKLSGVSPDDTSFARFTMTISGLGNLHAKNILKSECNQAMKLLQCVQK